MNELSVLTAWDENEVLMRSIVNEYVNDMNMSSQSKSEIHGICSLKIEEFKRQRFSFPSLKDLNKRFLEEMCQHVQRLSVKKPEDIFQKNDSIQLIHEDRSQQLNLRMKEKQEEMNQFDTPHPKDIDFSDNSNSNNKSIDALLEEEMKRRDNDFIPPSDTKSVPWDDALIKETVNKVNIKDEVSKLFKTSIQEEKKEKSTENEIVLPKYQQIQTESFPMRSILKRPPKKQCSRWLFDDCVVIQQDNSLIIHSSYLKYIFNRLFNEPDQFSSINMQIHSLVIKCNDHIQDLNTLQIKDVHDNMNTALCIKDRLVDHDDAIYNSTLCTEMSFDKIMGDPVFIKMECKYPIQKVYAHITFSKNQ